MTENSGNLTTLYNPEHATNSSLGQEVILIRNEIIWDKLVSIDAFILIMKEYGPIWGKLVYKK